MTSHDARFGALGYHLQLAEEEGIWVASAHRRDTGEAFGPPVPADTADEAAELLATWLEWQRRHMAALDSLQAAADVYNRLKVEEATADEPGRLRACVHEALAALDERRRDLDLVREQKPWPR